jgi:DNA-binding XRE family transcriptional regulator
MPPGQLCNNLLHKFLVGIRLSKRPHILQVPGPKTSHFRECFAQIVRQAINDLRAPSLILLPSQYDAGIAELRTAMDMTQESLANALHVKQASIYKMERRSDMYISTLSKTIEAMGGSCKSLPRCRMET